MRPFLRVGDQIVTSKLVLKDLSLGDLVICKLSSHLYIHRFLYRYGPFFITKGDNLPYIDMPLLSERLIGKAIAVRRCGKEMHLDNIVWRITNHILGAVSMLEAYTVKILRFIKRTLISP
ncbi:MAG: S24/S26 family peptidase [Candidatus Omnitrophota bacterium]